MARARKSALLAASTVRAFDGALPPTMPFADFRAAVIAPVDGLSPVAETQRRPPEVRSTAFTARSPDLPPRPLMTWTSQSIACSSGRVGLVIRFLSTEPQLCSPLPPDATSRRCPCASLILRRHQAG